jgi:hypothetical protein
MCRVYVRIAQQCSNSGLKSALRLTLTKWFRAFSVLVTTEWRSNLFFSYPFLRKTPLQRHLISWRDQTSIAHLSFVGGKEVAQ